MSPEVVSVEPVAMSGSVLVVDDTPANLLVLAAVLRPLGVRIVEVASGREALERIAAESFAVVLLDVQMPEMDGFETAANMRTLPNGSEVPIIFLTAIHRDEALVRRGYNAGAADYITKPFDADIVRARVRAFVNLYQQRERIRAAQVALRTQERDEAVRRLVAFERIAAAALETPDLKGLLDELLSIFMSAADAADAAAIFLRDGDRLRLTTSVGVNEALDQLQTLPVSEVGDGSTFAARGLFGAPLVHDGELLGVAYVGSSRSEGFSSAEKRLFVATVERASWAVGQQVKRARLLDILSSAPALISVIRDEGRVHDFVNPAYASFFGRTDLVGTALSELGLDATLGALAARAARERRRVAEDEVDIGEGRFLQVSAEPLRGAGSGDSVLLFAIDVSAQVNIRVERARLLELERAARHEAEGANRMKDEFLATVSHELRTPLNAILGWTVAARAKAPPELDRALAIVERNARAQSRIIDDVLDTSRIVSGKLDLQTSEVSLGDVVQGAIDATRQAAVEKDIAVSVDVKDARLVADPHRLQQVVCNLLTNAFKFTPKGGRVRLSASVHGETARIAVSDTGEGIDATFLPKVFHPFQQGDGSTSRRHGGLGLGLSIVRHIVEAHGGQVTASSDGRGKGASFVVALPLASALAASAAPATSNERAASERSRLSGVKVLVVDDDDDARALLVHVISQSGASVVEADSARAAFALVKSSRPNVMISDIAMPGGDGYGLMRAVRGLPNDAGGLTPAVAVTAQALASDADRSFAAGFQAHLNKPVDFDRLLDTVVDLLRPR